MNPAPATAQLAEPRSAVAEPARERVRSTPAVSIGHGRVLALVDVTDQRPYDQRYGRYRALQSEHIAQLATRLGWRVRRVLAEESGVSGVLRATDAADAVLLGGGEDVDPAVFGGERGYHGEGRHFPHADEAQIALVLRSLDRAQPLLGICRGLQVIDVALGGTLVPDLCDDSFHQNHGAGYDNAIHSHAARLEPATRLQRALGAEDVSVASGHHQAVAGLGVGLRVAATAPDGVVEAIEHMEAPITGVQWHPESQIADPAQFPALVGQLAGAASDPRR